MGEIMKFFYAMVIYLFMFIIVTEGKFIFERKKNQIFLLNLILNVSLHITNNNFLLFVIIAHFCDTVKDCRYNFICPPPRIKRCVMLFCRCLDPDE